MPVCDRCGFNATTARALGTHRKWRHPDGGNRRVATPTVVHRWKRRAGTGTVRDRVDTMFPHVEQLLDTHLGPDPGWSDRELSRRWRAWVANHAAHHLHQFAA